MLLITTNLPSTEIEAYYGIVSGQAVAGVNIIKDVFAKVSDVVGGYSGMYEKSWAKAHDRAQKHMIAMMQREYPEANAIIGVSFVTGTAGENGSMLTVVASGTGVRIKSKTGVVVGGKGGKKRETTGKRQEAR